MKMTGSDAREWPSYLNNRRDADYYERREEALRRLRLLIARPGITYMDNNIRNFEYLRNYSACGNLR